MSREEDRQEVVDKLERIQEVKEQLLEADRDRNEDMYKIAEKKLDEAEFDAEQTLEEYKDKYGKR